jgi:hypothetical protein
MVLSGSAVGTIREVTRLTKQGTPSTSTQVFQSPDPAHPELRVFGLDRYTLRPRRTIHATNGGLDYGTSSLKAQSIESWLDEPEPGAADRTPSGTVHAEGEVVLANPVGTLHAATLDLNYYSRTGVAHGASIDVPGLTLEAEEVDVTADRYLLKNVLARSTERHPVYLLRIRKVEVKKGQQVVARQAGLSLFGQHIYTFPRLTKSLDERVSGIGFPTLTLNSAFQPGIAYNSSLLVDQFTAAEAGYNASPGNFPSYSLQLSRSTVDPGQTAGFITPRTDLDERFGYGYFDNVQVRDPKTEFNYVSARRDTVSVGSFWNRGTIDRLNYQVFTKPLQVSYEHAMALGPLRTLTQASVADVRLEASEGYLQQGTPIGSDHLRFEAQSIAETPPWRWSRDITGHYRLVAATYQGGSHTFSWVQSQLGATYRLPRYFRVGGALVMATEIGDPLFLSDRLYSKNGFYGRVDFDYGPRRISVLSRFDFDRNRFFDHEIAYTQLAGLFSPFIAIRAFPAGVRIGIQLRANNIFKAAERAAQSTESNSTELD